MRSTGDRGESRKSCDQLATSHHSITSSARRSSDGGSVNPSALAVFTLMTSFELRGLLDRQVTWLGPLENLVHKRGGAPPIICDVRPVGDETAGVRELSLSI